MPPPMGQDTETSDDEFLGLLPKQLPAPQLLCLFHKTLEGDLYDPIRHHTVEARTG